jgi:hypothetical protein
MIMTVRVDVPALAALVAYLVARDDSQKKIDALTVQVESLTTGLHQSTADLQQSVDTNK